MKTTKFLTLILLISILSLASCGKTEEKKPEPAPVVEEKKPEPTPVAEEKKPVSEPVAAANPDAEKKIKAYEDFVVKFCALADKTAGAGLADKVTLTAQFTKDSATLTTLQTDVNSIKATSNEAQKARITAAGTKASACLKKGAK
jgi:hypothetical protein